MHRAFAFCLMLWCVASSVIHLFFSLQQLTDLSLWTLDREGGGGWQKTCWSQQGRERNMRGPQLLVSIYLNHTSIVFAHCCHDDYLSSGQKSSYWAFHGFVWYWNFLLGAIDSPFYPLPIYRIFRLILSLYSWRCRYKTTSTMMLDEWTFGTIDKYLSD